MLGSTVGGERAAGLQADLASLPDIRVSSCAVTENT
jgi:hypothetical protein